MSQENRSIASHQGSLVNSICATPFKLMASFSGLSIGFICCVPKVCCISARLLVDWNPLTSAVIKMSEILSAATVTTGAKTIPMTLLRLRYLSSFSILIKFLKLSLMTINGEATIYSRRIPILAINTNAKAINGKKSAIATHALIRKTPDVSHIVVMLESVSCAKFKSEEYIVTSGPTNHLDFFIRSEVVIARTFPDSNHVVHHCTQIHGLLRGVRVGVKFSCNRA